MNKIIQLSTSNEHSSDEATMEFARQCLKAHNQYRAIHGAPPLVLDQNLNSFAFERATKLASSELQVLLVKANNPYGENLYMGYNSAPNWELDPMDVVKTWYNKKTLYKYGEPDRKSLKQVSSFTQVVWKKTQKLGVGVAKSESGKVYVACNYEPAGNIFGQFEANVLPAEKSTEIRKKTNEKQGYQPK